MVSDPKIVPLADPAARPPDPNVIQRKAARPDFHIWTPASAGSGKTTVLINRMLRLMLPSAERPASPPENILALTFTKAGAGEMALRLNKKLRRWAITTEEKLQEELETLLGQAPSEDQCAAARALFAQSVDLPGGMNIMTIHSFCQSVLGRFPLEAGLTPGFQALEETGAAKLFDQALIQTVEQSLKDRAAPEGKAFLSLTRLYGEEKIRAALRSVIQERRQFDLSLQKYFGVDGYYTSLCGALDIQPGKMPEDLIRDFVQGFDAAVPDLKQAAGALAKGSAKTDQPRAHVIDQMLQASFEERISLFENYKQSFLKKDGDPRKTLATKKIYEAAPEIEEILNAQADMLYTLDQACKAAAFATSTRDMICFAQAVLNRYTDLKQERGALDFDDMILKTLELLDGKNLPGSPKEASAWVMYKLDQGVDHILLDEAQDTNPEQWDILRALCRELLSGEGSREDITRTLFVVGDSKQSIFSFQRAAPEKFTEMEDWFAQKAGEARQNFERVPMQISFRSAPSILKAVDAVFAQEHVRKGLGRDVQAHLSYHHRRTGCVELWPIFKPQKDETQKDFWAPPVLETSAQDPQASLCAYVTGQIKDWMEQKDVLSCTGKPVQPGDIMILVRTRTALVDKLVRALKLENIPVSGVDRLVVTDDIGVQDLMAAARFALQPGDDLSLAELLKSPLIGWDDDRLYKFAYGRDGTLYDALKNADQHITDYLDTLIEQGRSLSPYDFFAQILDASCPADPVSGRRAIHARLGMESFDPLDEFLSLALEHMREGDGGLQGFLNTQSTAQSEIKRQLEEAGGAVRIMTVHAAKGLEAPIVILPDTLRSSASRKSDAMLWPDRSAAPMPVFWGTSSDMPEKAQNWKARAQELQDEEYRRLLYVAMTRAEERLYICGAQGAKDPLPESWYHYIESGLQAMPEAETAVFKTGGEMIRLYNSDTQDLSKEKKEKETVQKRTAEKLPDWVLKSKAPPEPSPPRPLIPSRPAEVDQSVLSPVGADPAGQKKRFQRGNIIHKLLQLLPDIEEGKREKRAAHWLSGPQHDLSKEDQKEILKEVIAVLNHPDFAPVFTPGSLAEVPVTGLLDDKTLISGQIDRLVVTEDQVFIIDYKTNRPPPSDPKDVPALYKNQMEAYSRALEKIYPDKKIRRALLWTYGPCLMEIDIM